MTVPAGQTPIITYAYSGAGDYDFDFRIFKDTDLVLTHLDTNGVRTLFIIGSMNDYTVTLLDEGEHGGTCHITSTLVGGTVEIRRSLLQEQPTDWVNNDPFNAELLEIDLDRAIMIIQEMQVVVDGAYVASNWRADWLPDHPYYVRDLIVDGATGNIYTALTDHISSSDFSADLANGNWAILIDVAAVEAARLDAEQSAAEALDSANSATTSENNAASSESQAGISEVNAAVDSQDAANCRQAAYDQAVISQEEAWNAEAEKMSADSYANEPEDIPVKIWSSDGDGTFSSVDTNPIEYSAFHWKEKASAIASGGVDDITVTAPVTKGGTAAVPIIGVDGSPAGGTTGQLLAKASNADYDNEFIDPPESGGGGLEWAITATPVVGADANGYIMDVRTADGIINLPAGVEGFTVGAQQLGEFSRDQEFFVKFVPNGTENIEGSNEPLVMDTKSAEVVYSDATNGWQVQEATQTCTGNPLIANKPMLHAQDQKANGTTGGDSILGDNDRDINTTLTNEITGASLNPITGEVTLPAGVYFASIATPAVRVNYCRSYLRKQNDDNLLVGVNGYANTSNAGAATNSVFGDFELTETTTIKVVTYTGVATASSGLGYPVSRDPYEVYTDLKIWRLDQEIHTPVIALPPQTAVANVPVTGNIYGLEYAMSAGEPLHTIDVGAGSCMDATGLEEMVLAAGVGTGLVIPSAINTIYSLFITKTNGVVGVGRDTDVDGANLVVDYKRWVGFVLTDASGNIVEFKFIGDTLDFNDPQNVSIGGSLTTSYLEYLITSFVPISRADSVELGAYMPSSVGWVLISLDGSTTHNSVTTGVAGVIQSLGQVTAQAGYYLKYDTTTCVPVIISITLKR